MRIHSVTVLTVLISAAAFAFGCSVPQEEEQEQGVGSVRSALGKGQEKKGEQVFFGEFPGVQGNGRACATCHVEADGFQLTPQHVQNAWADLQARRVTDPNADDPLFRELDNDDGNFSLLRNNALVRVVITLPTWDNGLTKIVPLDDPNATEVSVWRSTQSVLNSGLTAPYQWDGRQATLQSQALGALRGHAQIQHDPNPNFLDDVANYEKTLFSSDRISALSDAIANGDPLPSTDGPLNGTEQRGKQLFGVFCATCHGGATGNVNAPFATTFQDILVSRPLPPPTAGITSFVTPAPLRVRTWQFRNADGSVRLIPAGPPGVFVPAALSTDPGKALISGEPGAMNKFDTPSLFGVSKTAPYFHDNSARDLGQVLVQYTGLYQFLIRLPAPPGSFNEGVRALAAAQLHGPALITPDMVAPIIAYVNTL